MAIIGNFQLSNQAGSHRHRRVESLTGYRGFLLVNTDITGSLIGQTVTLTSSLAASILTTQTIRFDPIVN